MRNVMRSANDRPRFVLFAFQNDALGNVTAGDAARRGNCSETKEQWKIQNALTIQWVRTWMRNRGKRPGGTGGGALADEVWQGD